MNLVAGLLMTVISIVEFIIIAQVIVHWLIQFEVVNIRNQQAKNLVDLLTKVTEPAYSRIRKFVPPIAGLDLTPLVALVACYLARYVVAMIFSGLPVY